MIIAPSALARDAFVRDWLPYSPVFMCPPPTLRHLVGVEAYGGLIIPWWASSPSWTLICQDGRHLNRIVVSFKVCKPYLTKGEDVTSDVFSGITKFPFLSLKVDGRVPYPFMSRVSREFCLLRGCIYCLK